MHCDTAQERDADVAYVRVAELPPGSRLTPQAYAPQAPPAPQRCTSCGSGLMSSIAQRLGLPL
jgi:hypothetical protein